MGTLGLILEFEEFEEFGELEEEHFEEHFEIVIVILTMHYSEIEKLKRCFRLRTEASRSAVMLEMARLISAVARLVVQEACSAQLWT